MYLKYGQMNPAKNYTGSILTERPIWSPTKIIRSDYVIIIPAKYTRDGLINKEVNELLKASRSEPSALSSLVEKFEGITIERRVAD